MCSSEIGIELTVFQAESPKGRGLLPPSAVSPLPISDNKESILQSIWPRTEVDGHADGHAMLILDAPHHPVHAKRPLCGVRDGPNGDSLTGEEVRVVSILAFLLRLKSADEAKEMTQPSPFCEVCVVHGLQQSYI